MPVTKPRIDPSPHQTPALSGPPLRQAQEAVRWVASRAGQWVGAFIAGLVHLWTVSQAGLVGWLPLQLLSYIAPAGLALVLRPMCRRHVYRFLAPLLFAYVSLPGLQVTVYLAVFCWVIRQCWFIDTGPADPKVRDLLRRARRKASR